MKKLKVLLLILAVLLVVPFGVFADEATQEDTTEVSNEVNVYLFYGDGCGFCANAKTWFEEIEEEYGDKFELIKYEVWYDEDNSNLMAAVGAVRNETPGGVPYIVIGNQSWDGFADDYKESILSKIESEYEQEVSERYDIMNYVDLASIGTEEDVNTTARDVLVLLVLVGVVAAVSVGVVVARKNAN